MMPDGEAGTQHDGAQASAPLSDTHTHAHAYTFTHFPPQATKWQY